MSRRLAPLVQVPHLSQEDRVRIAEFIKSWTYNFLISKTSIPRVTALCAACDAADEHARMLALVITEHMPADSGEEIGMSVEWQGGE